MSLNRSWTEPPLDNGKLRKNKYRACNLACVWSNYSLRGHTSAQIDKFYFRLGVVESVWRALAYWPMSGTDTGGGSATAQWKDTAAAASICYISGLCLQGDGRNRVPLSLFIAVSLAPGFGAGGSFSHLSCGERWSAPDPIPTVCNVCLTRRTTAASHDHPHRYGHRTN